MSNEPPNEHGYIPARPSGKPTKLTLDEFVQVKKIFEDSKLAKWIILAGIGALAELLHVVWLAIRYVWKL